MKVIGNKLILFNSSTFHKQGLSGSGGGGTLSPHHHHFHRLLILALLSISISTFTFIFTRIPTTTTPIIRVRDRTTMSTSHISPSIMDALLYYATSNTTDRMTPAEVTSIATTLGNCRSHHHPCNLLVFGLSHETLLWELYNNNKRGVIGAGRTVFIDDKEYRINEYEKTIPGFEGYDVKYTTKVSSLRDLIKVSRDMRDTDCRPVQNLLFSDCPLAINDLPNHLYDIPWDVIIIDGPSGYSLDSPGRMSVIFTAAVLARSKRRSGVTTTTTHVFVHEYGREAERLSGEEFLCKENLVEVNDSLAHFVVAGGGEFMFCKKKGKKRSKGRSDWKLSSG